jgi:hypothetical protein
MHWVTMDGNGDTGKRIDGMGYGLPHILVRCCMNGVRAQAGGATSGEDEAGAEAAARASAEIKDGAEAGPEASGARGGLTIVSHKV